MSEPKVDPARGAALAVLKAARDGEYVNLALKRVLAGAALSTTDAGFVTELVYGVSRRRGTLDLIIEAAAGRALRTLQPGVVDVLRLGAEQLLKMRVPAHASVAASVELAGRAIGRRTTSVVNAILRRVAERDWDDWIAQVSLGRSKLDRLAVRTCHPLWIVQVYAALLPRVELEVALEANNLAATPTLAIRPGLMSREALVETGGQATRYSPWGVVRPGDPGGLPAVRDGLAGVQDEGSQLVAGVLAAVEAARITRADNTPQ